MIHLIQLLPPPFIWNIDVRKSKIHIFRYAFGFPPHSPYLETFNAALLTLSEQNELDALWKKWSKGDCASKSKTTKSSSLNLANIYGLCYTFFVVIAVSGVILIGEILYESIMDVKRFKTVSTYIRVHLSMTRVYRRIIFMRLIFIIW